MTSAAPDPLAPLTALPGVAEAADTARDALAAVHRHPANRRGWPTTAAESVLRGARASAGVEGASVRLDSDGEPDEILSGALRVAGELTGESLDRAVAVWTRSPLQELAHLHLLAAARPDVDPQTLGRPRAGDGVAERLQGLAGLVTGGTRVPAPVLAAVVLGELSGLAPFGSADGIVAPMVAQADDVHKALAALSVATGAMIFSHVSDGAFWLFQEYFKLTVPQTLKTWSLLVTVQSVVGLAGLLVVDGVVALL